MENPTTAWLFEEFRAHAVAKDNTGEHGSSTYQLIMGHKTICFWTFFFAMSAVGWSVRLAFEMNSLTLNSGDLMRRSMEPCFLFPNFVQISGRSSLKHSGFILTLLE
jgi:hypothetical protein